MEVKARGNPLRHLPAKEATVVEFPNCHPSNPGCEYSEEHVSPDPASRTHVICLVHHDQIEAAKEAERRAQAEAPSTWDEKVWGPRRESHPNQDGSPF